MKTNKSIVLEVYREIFAQQKEEAVHRLVKENYIQHNPQVKDGKAGFLEFISFLRTLPKTNPSTVHPVMRLVEEGDLVAVHTALPFAGKWNLVMELYRLENGQLAEHWDVSQVVEGGPVALAALEISDRGQTDSNKKQVIDFFENAFTLHQSNSIEKYLHPGFIQYRGTEQINFDVLEKEKRSTGFVAQELVRVVAEGNLVYVQARKKNAFACSHLFRLEQGRIAEQWTVEQAIPPAMAHTNGMF